MHKKAQDIERDVENKGSLIKGRIAESLVKELFIGLGMDVYPYGIECQFPDLAKLYKSGKVKKNIALNRLAKRPDFIVCADRDGKKSVHRVEVKFRSSGKVVPDEILPYDDDVIFVFLDQETFYILENDCLKKKYKNKATIRFKNLTRLSQDSVFSFDSEQKQFVFQFSKYVSQYLSSPQESKKTKIPKKKSEKEYSLKGVLRRVFLN